MYLIVLIILAGGGIRLNEASHYYGEEMFCDITSNSTHETLTIHWRLMWRSGAAPSSENLYTCSSGSPCASGVTRIDMKESNCMAPTISTTDGSVSYDSWTGLDSSLYFPISAVPTPVSTLGLTFSGSEWGQLTATAINDFGGELIVLTSRRADNGLFNNGPRSPVAAVVTIWPACGGWNFTIPVIDPDGDPVQCRWSNSSTECAHCCANAYSTRAGGAIYPFALTSDCSVVYTGPVPATQMYYPICIQMEDFYPNDTALRISSSSLQFIVEVSPSVCTLSVSPLVTDNCSLAMVSSAAATCSGSPSVAIPNSVSSSNYSVAVGSSVTINCSMGYSSVSNGAVNVSCVAYNSTSGVWAASASSNCTCVP